MIEEILHHRDRTLVRRLRLEPGDALPWHTDPHHRVTVVLAGETIRIEARDGTVLAVNQVVPGQVDWDEPTRRVHRGVNIGRLPYEEVTIFFLDEPDAEPQPRA